MPLCVECIWTFYFLNTTLLSHSRSDIANCIQGEISTNSARVNCCNPWSLNRNGKLIEIKKKKKFFRIPNNNSVTYVHDEQIWTEISSIDWIYFFLFLSQSHLNSQLFKNSKRRVLQCTNAQCNDYRALNHFLFRLSFIVI